MRGGGAFYVQEQVVAAQVVEGQALCLQPGQLQLTEPLQYSFLPCVTVIVVPG